MFLAKTVIRFTIKRRKKEKDKCIFREMTDMIAAKMLELTEKQDKMDQSRGDGWEIKENSLYWKVIINKKKKRTIKHQGRKDA